MANETVELLLSGMVNADMALVQRSLSPRAVLRSPILDEPVEGPDAIVGVIGPLRGRIDTFELLGIMEGDGLHSTSFRYVAGDVTIEGMDLIRLGEDGLIEDLRVFWRPLPTIVRMQQRIADALGVPKLRLEEQDTD